MVKLSANLEAIFIWKQIQGLVAHQCELLFQIVASFRVDVSGNAMTPFLYCYSCRNAAARKEIKNNRPVIRKSANKPLNYQAWFLRRMSDSLL